MSPDAKRALPRLFSLDRAPAHTEVEVVEIRGSSAIQRQLSQLQVRVHGRLRVRRSAPMGGPVMIEAGGTTVAIGRKTAETIFVHVVPA